jgi:nucleoid-associated protein YgaU
MTSCLLGRARRVAVLAAAGTASLVVATGLAAPAQAVTAAEWDRLAMCESSGRWNINTGNGYYGGLQFSPSSWAYAGGTKYAKRADLATKAEQIATATRLLALQGWGAWPGCSKKLGLRTPSASSMAPAKASTSSRTTSARGQVARPAPRATRVTSSTRSVVRSGDTLSRIAARSGVRGGWQALWAANRSTVPNPNVIRVGQVLRIP